MGVCVQGDMCPGGVLSCLHDSQPRTSLAGHILLALGRTLVAFCIQCMMEDVLDFNIPYLTSGHTCLNPPRFNIIIRITLLIWSENLTPYIEVTTTLKRCSPLFVIIYYWSTIPIIAIRNQCSLYVKKYMDVIPLSVLA